MVKHDRNELAARDKAICERLLAGGITMSALAREHGMTPQRMHQIALRNGITSATYFSSLPPTKAQQDADRVKAWRNDQQTARQNLLDQILIYRRNGLSQEEISRRMGLSRGWISDILRQAGFGKFSKGKKSQSPMCNISPKVRAPCIVGMAYPPTHTHETVQRALALWVEGLSARQIAARLTTENRPISKNAIVGLANRNKFPTRENPIIYGKHRGNSRSLAAAST